MEFKIYTNYEKFKGFNVIKDNDAFFYENVSAENFSDIEIDVMKDIDNAELLDDKYGKIQTPRGICSIENLSTGCKTILNYLYICNSNMNIDAIDITGCGANAIEKLFQVMEIKGETVNLILMHKDKLFDCNDREYIIDDIKSINSLLYM